MSSSNTTSRMTRMFTGAAITTAVAVSVAACSSTGTGTPSSSSPTLTVSTATASSSAASAPTNVAGFDGVAFQGAMAAIGVPATGPDTGKGATGIGSMQYTFTRNASAINTINCTATAEGATAADSDSDALTLASTFLASCATWNLDGQAKADASTFVSTNLKGLQAEQPVTTAIAGTQLKLGKQAPGFYFLLMTR